MGNGACEVPSVCAWQLLTSVLLFLDSLWDVLVPLGKAEELTSFGGNLVLSFERRRLPSSADQQAASGLAECRPPWASLEAPSLALVSARLPCLGIRLCLENGSCHCYVHTDLCVNKQIKVNWG